MPGLEGAFCFHVGYHRTGTTFLQQFVLPQYHAHEHIFPPDQAARALKRYLLDEATPDSLVDIASRGEDFSWYRTRRDRRVFLSQEALSGDLFADNLSMVDTIRRCCPDSTILVTLRSQHTLLPSLYQYLYVKSGRSGSYRDYVRLAMQHGKCDYHALVSRYVETFGKDAVCVLLYEDLRDDPTEFLRQFFGFLGLPPPARSRGGSAFHNKRPHVLEARLGRLTNAILAGQWRRAALRLGRAAAVVAERAALPVRPFEDDPVARRAIDGHYAAGNRTLARLLNRDLAARGYPTGETAAGHRERSEPRGTGVS